MNPDELADTMIAAIERGDVDAVSALYADDIVVWHNFDGVEQTKDANLAVLAWLTKNVTNLRYEDITRHPTEGGFVEQHVLRATTKAGAELEVPACLVVTIAGDKITRIDEYLDTAQLSPLTA
jgi:ketosteroid isomerase-like protein